MGARPLPDGLFKSVYGHDEVKHWLRRSLESERPVHVCLVGPPGMAKSLIAEAIEGLRKHGWSVASVQGPPGTKPALRDLLADRRPDVLLIDVFDKLPTDCYDLLLEPMEHGRLTVVKKAPHPLQEGLVGPGPQAGRARHQGIRLRQQPEEGSPALTDRFIVLRLREYSRDEYLEVAFGVLTEREGVEPDLARYMAERTANHLSMRSVRELRNIARLCKTKGDADRYIQYRLEHEAQRRLTGYIAPESEGQATRSSAKKETRGTLSKWT